MLLPLGPMEIVGYYENPSSHMYMSAGSPTTSDLVNWHARLWQGHLQTLSGERISGFRCLFNRRWCLDDLDGSTEPYRS